MTNFKFEIGDRVEYYGGWELPMLQGNITNRKAKPGVVNGDRLEFYKLSGYPDQLFQGDELVLLSQQNKSGAI